MEKGIILTDRVKEHYHLTNHIHNEYSCVLYWMQQSQRVEYNHALYFSIEKANQLNLPLVVFFGLTEEYPKANGRHLQFMAEGLKETAKALNKRGIGFVMEYGDPKRTIISYLKKAKLLVMDKGYLQIQRQWRMEVAEEARELGVAFVYEVESDICVPVEVASDKEEYMARTIRPKIWKVFDQYTEVFTMPKINVEKPILNLQLPNQWKQKTVPISPLYRGGYKEAKRLLEVFIENKLSGYDKSRFPEASLTSLMSAYLHFGQISPLEIYHRVKKSEVLTGKDAFVEQLVIRRELAINYVYYRRGYDRFETMTNEWAYKTMECHRLDQRTIVLGIEELENGHTPDIYWNAAMKEMIETGYMHNTMRMYWCKKIIEWSKSFEEAYKVAIYLNDKYFLDGRDPNSYTGVAWCFGLHDQGWKEREIFGKLRYMNARGLERKYDMKKYLKQRIHM